MDASNSQKKGWYDRVEDVPPGSALWVTFVNGDEKYREMMINWAYHLRALDVPHLVVAFDDVAAAVCADKGITHLRHVETLVSGDFRADFSKFRKMGSNKPLIVLRLLQEHHLSTVIISDVDTVWMRDPSEFLLRHPSADVLISTDCLSHWVEASFDPEATGGNRYFHRCGHLPGATFGRAFNTGVIIFRNRPATLDILRAWRALLTDPDSAYAPSTRGGAFAITDQLAFNMLLEQNIAPIASTGDDWRVIWAMNNTLQLMPLPSLLFTTGHTYFNQHLPALHGVKAYVVHCTFQRHHTPGKRARLREEGLWLADPPEYFEADHLLSYTNDVASYIAALDVNASEPLPALFKHFHAMSYQLAALRDAFAIAVALNRTLVIPRMTCFCDQDWYASILPNCRVDGSDLTLPFTCPIDVLFNPAHLDASPWPYRMASFLDSPQTSAKVRFSQEAVVMDANAAWVAFRSKHVNGAGSFLATGQSAPAIAQALASMERVHVLRFQGLQPGAFGGFGSLDLDSAFDKAFAAVVGQDAKWCCSGEQPIDVSWITWHYLLPTPLSKGVAPSWPIPRYAEPPHCERIRQQEAGQLNVDFLKLENHPCTFLFKRVQLPATLGQVLPAHTQLELPQPGVA